MTQAVADETKPVEALIDRLEEPIWEPADQRRGELVLITEIARKDMRAAAAALRSQSAEIAELEAGWDEARAERDAAYIKGIEAAGGVLRDYKIVPALEANLATAVKALSSVKTWAEQKCPCHNEEPNPCPLCGASVENLEGCKAVDNTFPRHLREQIDRALSRAALKEVGADHA